MSFFRRRKPGLGRKAAMTARPRQAPVVRTKHRPDDGVNVTVMIRRPRWHRWLGGSERSERTFGLDAYGREVFEACDGKRSVRAIVRRFAANHEISRPEAELSVTTFLKTLMAKGLVVMELDKPAKGRRK